MGQTSLLHYFATKRHLLVAVLDRRDTIADNGPIDRESRDFPTVLVDQARWNESVPGLIELYAVVSGEASTDDHPARDSFVGRFARLRGEYRAELLALQEAGRLREGVHVERAAATVIALWDPIQTQWLLDDSVDMAACLADHLGLIIRAATE